MSRNTPAPISVLGIGKNAFHVVGPDERGAIVLRQKWSRGPGGDTVLSWPISRTGVRSHSDRVERAFFGAAP